MELEFVIFAAAAAVGLGLFSYLFYVFRPARRSGMRVGRRRSRGEEPPRYF